MGRPRKVPRILVADCLAPLVTVLRAGGVRKIGVVTPIARGSDGTAEAFRNQAASDFADWLVANAASVGVDAVADSRTDPALDCRLWRTNTRDTTVYQADRTHLMANGYINHLGPLCTGLLDQFWRV
jgi:hypothetical protein